MFHVKYVILFSISFKELFETEFAYKSAPFHSCVSIGLRAWGKSLVTSVMWRNNTQYKYLIQNCMISHYFVIDALSWIMIFSTVDHAIMKW